jgi:hypothetical protein
VRSSFICHILTVRFLFQNLPAGPGRFFDAADAAAEPFFALPDPE